MTIRTRLLSIAGVCIAGVAGILILSVLGISHLQDNADAVINDEFVPLIEKNLVEITKINEAVGLILNADRDAYQALLAEKKAIFSVKLNNPKMLKKSHGSYLENAQQVADRMGKASEQLEGNQKDLYTQFKAQYDQWREASGKVFEICKNNESTTMNDLIAYSTGKSKASFGAMRDIIDQITEQLEAQIKQQNQVIGQRKEKTLVLATELNAYAHKQQWLVLSAGSVICVVVAGMTFVIISVILKRLKEIASRAQELAEGDGDLTQRLDESKDEIGILAKRINAFIQKVHDTIWEVAKTTSLVVDASQQIAQVSQQMSQANDSQATQVSSIAAAVEEMSQSVAVSSEQSTEAANRAKQSGDVATEGGNIVQQTISGMCSIQEAVTVSSNNVELLGQRSEQIGQVIMVINDIADQTNLLALNAAIEAARAGEHGRGFAVVADEVRKLADRTTKATGEITDSIKAIQAETTQAVEQMQGVSSEVEQGVQRATSAGSSLEQIVTSTQQVAQMIESVSASSNEQATAAEQVACSLDTIRTLSVQTKEDSNRASETASELIRTAGELQQRVRQFKLAD